ncbi:hypothetical protein [Bacillus cereus group sp. BfR-BA-01330]|uniref:hypothetical protein n=1 Tax=Bacillus cereus group sp. BfR-BA-01330 TaxID=2920306 RepID=UPI001F5A0E35
MLLMTNKSDCANEMDAVSNFALRILKYVESKGSCDYDEEDFLKEFDTEGIWFLTKNTANKNKVQQGMKELFKLKLSERKKVRIAFEKDYRFSEIIVSEGKYEFETRKLSKHLLQALKSFLEPFYDIIFSKGAFENIKGLTGRLNRKSFLSSYVKANPKQTAICPACLDEMKNLKNIVNKEEEEIIEIIGDVDHYFLKSEYPILSVSPDNLIPMCKACNQSLKHTKNPINESENYCVSSAFYPYKGTGMSQIKLDFSGNNVTVIPKETSNLKQEERIKNMNRLFKIEQNWTSGLERIRLIRLEAFAADLRSNFTLEELTHKIESEWQASKRFATVFPGQFLAMHYWEWVLKNNLHQVMNEVREIQGLKS